VVVGAMRGLVVVALGASCHPGRNTCDQGNENGIADGLEDGRACVEMQPGVPSGSMEYQE
jgi:hypothetical protein